MKYLVTKDDVKYEVLSTHRFWFGAILAAIRTGGYVVFRLGYYRWEHQDERIIFDKENPQPGDRPKIITRKPPLTIN